MLTTEQIADLKRAMPCLETMSRAMTERLAHEADYVKMDEGAGVFDEDVPCQTFILLTSGALRVVKTAESGRELLLYRVQPGEVCVITIGCLLGGSPYPARGVAEDDLTGARLSQSLFEALVVEVPEFRRAIFQLLGERLASLMRLVEEVAFHRLDERLAALLLRQSSSEPSEPIRLTHQEIADDLGSAREIVSRILESFEAEGLVELGRRRINVLDTERLSGVATRAAG
jgi:CRP/FNR family transcriptional regulator